jgi:hypothetical protein
VNTEINCSSGPPTTRFYDRIGRVHSTNQIGRGAICGVLSALAALVSLRLGVFDPILPGLDASWIAVLGGAAERGELFGRDLISTGGPLSALYSRFFDVVEWPWVLLAGALIAGTLAWASSRLASNWSSALLLPAAILLGRSDGILISMPALAALAVLIRPGVPCAFILLAAVATGAAALAKFSIVPVAIIAFAIIDIAFWRERRFPVALVSFVAAVIGWFAFLQGGVSYLIPFLRYSSEISIGYSDAMSLSGSVVQLACFLVMVAAFALIIIVQIFRSPDRKFVTQQVLTVMALTTMAFVGFKAGFIRYDDLHSLYAWSVLAVAAAAYLAFLIDVRLMLPLAAISVVSIVTTLALPSGEIWRSVPSAIEAGVLAIGTNLRELAYLAVDPAGWLRAQAVAMEKGRTETRAAIPLPPLDGSVDALPSIQSAVIAAGLKYRPRFAVQEYVAYTRALIDQNHSSWFGPHAPDYIVFGLVPIDGRLPALSEGPLWPDLLRYYEPVQRYANVTVLRHRSAPLAPLLGDPITREVRLGERFELSRDSTFVTLNIRLNGLGRLLSVLFRPPHVNLHLIYADGRETVHRIIPEIAQAGFVIAPAIQTADDFVQLALGEPPPFAGAWPVSAVVELGANGSFAYDSDTTLTARSIDIAALRRAPPEFPGAQQVRRELAALTRLLAAVQLQSPYLDRVPEGLMAHAPRKIAVPVEKARSATVMFGFRRDALIAGKPPGACFRALSDAGTVLWERCLDPMHRIEDRGQQTATFALPPGQTQVTLETRCAVSCDWAWTYWAGFEPNS